jgi:transposase
MADKAYSSKANRRYLRRRGIKAVIPVKKDQQANRHKLGSRGGRPPAFDRDAYTERNTIERCVNKLRQHRAVQPDTTNENASTRAPSTSHPSASGSGTQSREHGTGPSGGQDGAESDGVE